MNKMIMKNILVRFAAVVMMMAWTGQGMAQNVMTEGLYYLGSHGYNSNNTTTNYYLCPTEEWAYYQSTSPYYYLYYEGCNTDQPFMTTYQCRDGAYDSKKALWVVQQSPTPGYFYVIHLIDGKYLTYNDWLQAGNKGRMRLHLQDGADGDNALFKFTYISDKSSYDFITKNYGPDNNNRKYVNVTGVSGNGNQPSLQATDLKHDGPNDINVGGIIGLWTSGSASDNASRWYPESTLLTEPTISGVSQVTGRVTVTDVNGLPAGYNIRYTVSTDGTAPADPTATSAIMDPQGYLVEQECIIKAVVERYGVVLTEVATSGILVPTIPHAPTVTTNCDNTFSLVCDNMPEVGIYYTLTTNGDEPAEPTIESTPYTAPVEYGADYKIKAKAIQIGGNSSGITSHEFTQGEIHTEAPVITLEGTTISISCATTGASIYYTIDGHDPTNSSTFYNGSFTIDLSGEVDVRAIAESSDMLTSCVSRFVIPTAPSVVITADDCSASAPRGNVVTITGPDDGRTFWYAVTAGANSAAPDVNAIPNPYSQYTDVVALDDLYGTNTHYTIHAYAKSSDGLFNSPVVSVSREMKTGGKPTLTSHSGSSPVISISGGVFGDVAVCSVSGVATQSIPIASDGTAEYTIAPEASGALSVAFKHGDWLNSCEATYVLPEAPETPTWSQDCSNKLSLHCATLMADIHYTIGDNENPPAEPTLESATYTPGCLDDLPFGKQIRAKAFVGFRASNELSYTYVATHSDVPQFLVQGNTVTISVPNHDYAVIYVEHTENGEEPDDPTLESQSYIGSYNFSITEVAIYKAIAVHDGLEPSCVVRVVLRPGYSINDASDLSLLSTYSDGYFFVLNDIDASGYTTTVPSFTGVIEGNNYTISNLTAPLINTATDAVIHDLTLDNVQVNVTTSNTHAGAFAQTANGDTRIYNCGIIGENSSVSGTKYVGGLVGLLDGSARVINCFSYANINGGTHRAGIVGYNNVASTSGNLKTMVMNCMFYGDISTDGNPMIYPVYGGQNIHNNGGGNITNTGLNNYCYFYYHGDYVNHINNDNYHGSLGAEERFLNRFEFFRLTLNSTRNIAAYYISGDATETDLVAKWVLDKSIAPYPILKEPGYYPSIVNHDAEHAVPIDPDNEHYNEGRKLGTLTVKVQMGSGGPVFSAPTGASIPANTQLTLNITDKDFEHDDYSSGNYDFNYKKVQLPYYNQVGTGNYTHDRVVTGWKIVEINNSNTGTGSFTTDTHDYPDWNFVDRACSNKDLYSVSERVFNQGAYWEVPDGVTSITIEPYWAKAVYLSDKYYDVTYRDADKTGVIVAGQCPTSFNEQTVYNAITNVVNNNVVEIHGAIEALEIVTGHTVYDYAVVLVGNYHQYAEPSLYSSTANNPVTFMSADLDGDCEPDNTLFYYHKARQRVAPVRFDFLNMPGIGMVKRTWNSDIKPEPGIFKPAGWFEVTNTVFVRFGQFEYCDGETSTNQGKLFTAPLILQGGIYEQFVSSKQKDAPDYTNYILVGGNAWFKNFANGCHTDAATKTHNMPINVAGGDYENFYLSGIYRPGCPSNNENAECYIDGGRFEEVAGAGMQLINGDVTWRINAADMEKFFGGGINAAQSITGNVTDTISNSRVTEYYGGPKFGEMQNGKVVTTIATNCHFGLFFGAGHGGTAYNRLDCEDKSAVFTNGLPPWDNYVDWHYSRSYEGIHTSHSSAGANVNHTVNAISTSYEYEHILHSDGKQTVARFFVNFASLSLASTKDVVSKLTDCTIGTFYGGGRLGAVEGDVNSTLTDCTVEGNVFGSGFSAETPSLMVMNKEHFVTPPKFNRRAGVFNDAEVTFPGEIQYYWKHTDVALTPESTVFEDYGDEHYILTNENLNNLGAVLGNTTLTINGNRTVVKGDVYGGGALSSTNTGKTIQININEGVYGEAGAATGGNIYGGGMGNAQNAVTEGTVELNIGNASQEANSVVIHGSVFGCNNVNGSPKDNATVHVYKTMHDNTNVVTGSGYAIKEVFGGGNQAHYQPTTADKKATVHVHNCDNTIEYIYGGGNAADVGTSAVNSATDVIIDGGRHKWVFGGGNGYSATNNHTNPNEPNYNPGANIFGNTSVTFHAGDITYLFGGSNEWGTVSGDRSVSLLNDETCSIPNHIAEFYGGNNKAPIESGYTLNMPCTPGSDPCPIDYLFGGSRMADINGDVTLTVEGGLYNYVFGGNNLSGTITGNVTLNLYGGTINEAAFGGNKGGLDENDVFYDGGTITGDITVNVEDQCGDCPLQVKNIFGAGDLAVYTAPTGESARAFNPMVNVNNICAPRSITGSVFGGGNGDETDETQTKGSVVGNPQVIIGDLTTGHETYRAAISGNVYGGGNAAKVTGNTTVLMQKENSTVGDNLFGGGNQAGVSGTATVTMNQGSVSDGIYGGCNSSGTVSGNINVSITGGIVGANGNVANVHGGGYGHQTATEGNVNVTINGATAEIWGAVYGGSALGNVNDASTDQTNVTLTSGTIHGDLYGGGLGDNGHAAAVNGAVQVTVNGGTVTGSVYGCNNVNGAPQSTVKVDIYGTDPASGSSYALGHVFGGGNMAAYGGTPIVKIHGCSNSIEYVYGGGNAASVDSTDVTVWGGTIGYVFGGGNGTGVAPTYEMVTKGVKTLIYGGTIGKVFGTNNSNGTVGGNKILVYIHKKPEDQRIGCDMKIGEVYGGGNLANGKAGIIDIRCTGTLEPLGLDERYGYEQEGIGTVYGGANRADISNDINLNIKSGIIQNVFGGNNNSGLISGSITVTIKKNDDATCASQWYVGDVFGGGNHAHYFGTPDVNIVNGTVSGSVYGGGNDITDGTLGVTNSDVVMVGGTVLGGIYGGCCTKGSVTGNSVVTITGGVIGSQDMLDDETTTNVFGGGYGVDTEVNGDVMVTITRAAGETPPAAPTIYGDVYGGSALGQVNSGSSNTTTVKILDGTLVTKTTTTGGFTTYLGGNVFGGGLGVDNDPANADKGKVNGKVVVNIGLGTPDPDNPYIVAVTGLSGNATIGGNVYGCNNSGGSPQDDVTVNIFQTAHTDGTDGTPNNTLTGDAFAIANVFGGGNEADFSHASGKKAYVNIYTCNNTIRRVFGGGNAASTPDVITNIQGGRFDQVFGGGNGERGAQYGADVYNNVTLNLHGGDIGEYYGGSNLNGTIHGDINTNVLNDGPCENVTIEEFFCGGNFVDIYGDIVTTIACSDGHFKSLYGGCNQAKIYGNVVLNLCGGVYDTVFGGSKGRAGLPADILDYSADYIEHYNDTTHGAHLNAGDGGKVTLNLYGGTIKNVFGGSNVNGNIYGLVTVNVIDDEGDCPLYITNIYGGSNMTDYSPTYTPASGTERITPVVNLVHAKYGISGNVYGGSKGVVGNEVDVTSSPLVNIGYDAASMNTYIPSAYLTAYSSLLASPRAIVAGSVFGGGDAAKVVGNTAIFLRNRAKVFGNVYGGGNMGEVTGDTKVIVNGDRQ